MFGVHDKVTMVGVNAKDMNGEPLNYIIRFPIDNDDFDIPEEIRQISIMEGFTDLKSEGCKISFEIFIGKKTKLKNGEQRQANDFLYGIVYDPLHIEEEFDNGAYRTFCEFLDRLFTLSIKNQKLPSSEVKRVMNILPDFLNKKINYYLSNNLMNAEVANQIVGNFNSIWDSMQREYGAFFSQDDIDGIASRAGRTL